VSEPPRPTALITGATAGLGASFARQIAARGSNVVLVARDGQRLAALAAELAQRDGIEATPLVADLATDEGCAAVERRLRADEAPVELLVNNAGFSLNTPFLRSAPGDEARLLQVNVAAVMRLTLAALPGMVARRRGSVINVSSVSGFFSVIPGSTYPATKAWVTNFSQSVGYSVRRYGVRVMALCPGYTRTEFHARAGIDMSKTPAWMWLDADRVVQDALRDLGKGKAVSVPDWKYKLAVALGRHAPLAVLQRVARDTRGREGARG
jgi:hypothetical protein